MTHRNPHSRRGGAGMTVLELMIVLAIIAGSALLVRSGFRLITKADLVENATELSAVLRRAQQLAVEHGELHRVTLDLDKQLYVVEVCQGAKTIQRNEAVRPDQEQVQRAVDRGKEKLLNVPPDVNATDPDAATKRAIAIAGHHIADRMCTPAKDSITGDAEGFMVGPDGKTHEKGWVRALKVAKGIKFKEVWVQHRDDSVTKGQVAIYFWPVGSSEKAVIEISDGSETFSVLVYGLTGRVELKDGELRDVNEHMLRNAMGDKNARREEDK